MTKLQDETAYKAILRQIELLLRVMRDENADAGLLKHCVDKILAATHTLLQVHAYAEEAEAAAAEKVAA